MESFEDGCCCLKGDYRAYLEFNYLVEQAKAVIIDSVGITEETSVLEYPALPPHERRGVKGPSLRKLMNCCGF
jgi:hypothetical protein